MRHIRSLAGFADKTNKISFCIYQAYTAIPLCCALLNNYLHKDTIRFYQCTRIIPQNKNRRVFSYPSHCDKTDNACDCDSN